MRNFVRNAIKGRRYNAFNQHYKSDFSDEVFKIISKELDFNGNICEILGKHFEFLVDKYEKRCAKNLIQSLRIIDILIKQKKKNIIT